MAKIATVLIVSLQGRWEVSMLDSNIGLNHCVYGLQGNSLRGSEALCTDLSAIGFTDLRVNTISDDANVYEIVGAITMELADLVIALRNIGFSLKSYSFYRFAKEESITGLSAAVRVLLQRMDDNEYWLTENIFEETIGSCARSACTTDAPYELAKNIFNAIRPFLSRDCVAFELAYGVVENGIRLLEGEDVDDYLRWND
jgi:hypothetical protein